MTKYICTNSKCKHRNCMLDVEDGVIVEDAVCQVRGVFLSTQWKVCDKLPGNWYNTKKTELPKLTAEVFDRPDCPEWANYAAVDESGSVRLFSDPPWLSESCWNWSKGEVRQLFCGKFDASDWQKSRIKRPKKTTLPDWCKVGKYVWITPFNAYMIVEGIDGSLIKGARKKNETFSINVKDLRQARLRPYNAEEMRGLVGKVVSTKRDCGIITGYRGEDNKVIVAWENIRYSADALLEIGATIDDAPCGVIQRFEDGSWVE